MTTQINTTQIADGAITAAKINSSVQLGGPTITAIGYPGDDTAADTAGGQTITLTGTGFKTGASVIINGTTASVVTFVSNTSITFTSPAQSSGSYVLYLVNTDGGTAIAVPGIQYSGTPAWSTAAGSLATYTETVAISNTVIATGDAPITYSLYSGSLPTGATLNTASGLISGSSPLANSATTYNFTIRATDAQNQDTNRAFSITINPDVVTWSSPANGTTYSVSTNSPISNVALSATAASGQTISYTANSLPTGLTLSGNTISGTPTVANTINTLLTATSNNTNKSAVQIINWVVSVAADTYFPYVSLLLSADTPANTFVSDTSANFAITVNGDTKPNSFNPYTPGYYSNYFDGTGDYLSTPSSGNFTASGDFTFSCWVYPTSFSVQTCITTNYPTNDSNSFSFEISTAGAIVIYVNGLTSVRITSSTNIPLNSWSFITVARSSTTTTLYINGVSNGTYSGSYTLGNATRPVIIGMYNNNEYFTGYIADYRWVTGSVITTVPTTPTTAISGTQLLTCQSNRFIDNSTNNYTITKNGDTTVSGFIPYTPNSSYSTYGSGYFDGTGDYITTSSSTAALGFGTGDFTVEFWAYAVSFPGSYNCFFEMTNYNTGLMMRYQSTSDSLYVAGIAADWNPVANFPLKQWNHVAITRSSTSLKVFVNGTSVFSATNSSNLGSSNNMRIGDSQFATGYTWPGYITDFRAVKGTAVYTSNFTPPSSPLTAIANTGLLTLQNNQPNNNNMFVDNSTNNLLITRNGNTTSGTFSPYAGSYSNYFDGTGDYLTSSVVPVAATGTFTIECWIYVTSSATQIIYAQYLSSDSTRWYFAIDNNSGYKLVFNQATAGPVWGATVVPLNQWNHIAVTRDSSNIIRIFLNGALDATSATYSASLYTGASQISGFNNNPAYYITGYISNLRILSGTALYTSAFTPPTTPLTPITNTKLLTCQSNRLIDNSVSNSTLTRNGDVSVQKFSPFTMQTATVPTSYSAYFDGSGDYLTIPNNSAFALPGDFTIELWANFNTNTTSVFCGRIDSSGYGDWGFIYNNAAGIRFITDNLGTVITGTYTVTLGTWTHIAISRSGTSVKIFANGVLLSTTTNSSSNGFTGTMHIGSATDGGLQFPGYMSNLRIVKGTAVYTSAFTPPSSPLTAIANTSLLTCQSTTFIDNSTNNFTITAYGNSKPTIQNPFGYTNPSAAAYTVSSLGGSMYFDGTGDYLNSTTTQIIPATSNFTLEAYVYCTSFSASPCIISQGTSGSAGRFQFSLNTSGNIQMSITSSIYTSTGTIGLNSWNHLVITRSGSTFTFYINGVSSGTATDATSIQNTSIKVGVEWSTGYFPGYISGLRLLTGTILYTSNFVPPYLSPLTAVQNTTLLLNGTTAGIYDSSMNNDLETVGDTKISTAVKKYGNGSIYFDGTGDYLDTPSNNSFTFGTGDFTIEFWLNTSSTGFNIMNPATATGTGYWGLLVQTSNLRWNSAYAVTNLWLVDATSILNGQWNHVAICRAAGVTKAFFNGTVVAANADTTNYSGVAAWRIGSGNVAGLNGYLDDFRVTLGVARYTGNFTAPTTAFIAK